MRLGSLDGLRGVAVLFVLLSHLSAFGLNFSENFDFSGAGKYGVFLFFVLSSFLLTRQLLVIEQIKLLSSRLWIHYFTRRIFRIYPLYFIAVIANAVLWEYYQVDYAIRVSYTDIIPHLLLNQGLVVFWTIPVEFKYYLLLPFIVIAIQILLKGSLSAAIVFNIVLISIQQVIYPEDLSIINDVSLLPHLSMFLLGSLSAVIYEKLLHVQVYSHTLTKVVLEFCSLAILAFIVCLIPGIWNNLNNTSIAIDSYHRSYLLFGLLWSGFLITHLFSMGLLRVILMAWPLRYLGQISFSVYLCHFPVLLWVKRHFLIPEEEKIYVIIYFVLLISSMTYWLVERPFLSLSRRLLISHKKLHANEPAR